MIRNPLPVFAAALLVPLVATLAAGDEVAAASELAVPSVDLSGLQERLREDRGHPLLVNFWATWCVPCIHEIPTLNRMQQDLGPVGARFLAVSLDPFVYPKLEEARARVATLIREESFRLPVILYDGDQDALEQMFQLPAGLPHTILVGPDGKVLDRVEGQLRSEEVERLAGKIREALEDSVP